MTERQPQVPTGTKREILIDGDILIYQTALQNEEAVNWGDGLWTLHSYEDKCCGLVDEAIKKLKQDLQADRVKICLTSPTNFRKDVLQAYLTLIPGAFKADLWRYCVLYIEGGVYVDADTICELPLNDWILGDAHFIATRDDPMAHKWLGNAFIGTVTQNPLLKDCIDRIVKHCQDKKEMFYLDYTGPALLGKCVILTLVAVSTAY